LFIFLWLLVGGGSRGYFGGGAASEVDGIFLMFLALFNVTFLASVFVILSPSTRAAVEKEAGEALTQPALEDEERLNRMLRSAALWALVINGVLILFVGMWLAIHSDRWGYFQASAAEVDMILLFFLSILNIAYMGLMFLRFSRTGNR
jgi:hypothetical protein